ncbi:nitroreductase family protein [Persicobacter sp. CCB-QB2]|nr:nitroreductase family protein [Persicobacter sp. CCB-QB2]
MESRYTTKMYDASKKVSPAQIADLKRILQLSPSSINSQPWGFTFVEEEQLKAALAQVSLFNAPKVENASHVVVFNVISDLAYFEENHIGALPERQQEYYKNFLKPMPEAEIKAWMKHQVYLALGVFLSACAEMGIDSTPMEGIDVAAYADLLKLEKHETVFAVAIGYRDVEDFNQLDKNPKQRKVLEEVIATI